MPPALDPVRTAGQPLEVAAARRAHKRRHHHGEHDMPINWLISKDQAEAIGYAIMLAGHHPATPTTIRDQLQQLARSLDLAAAACTSPAAPRLATCRIS
jgi:hypothetical protein